MTIRIESPSGTEALTEFILFHDEVYRARRARWSAGLTFQVPALTGQSPFAEERRLRPLVARVDGQIAARALAVLDERYDRHWGERLGHLSFFEARPDTRAAVRRLVDTACLWLADQGAIGVRAGWGFLDFPFAVDEYEVLPPVWLRQNPAHYHALLKDAGFETEQGWVDYRIAVTPQRVREWRDACARARAAGFTIVPVDAVAMPRRVDEFTRVWNDAFARHWGHVPFTTAEIAYVMETFASFGMLDASRLAYRDGEAVGALWYLPDTSAFAQRAPGRVLTDVEHANCLGIAVCELARGRGLNLALAASAFLDSAEQGATHLSYTLVLDHNWPSRRTAERLGASVCATYVTYRRDLRRG